MADYEYETPMSGKVLTFLVGALVVFGLVMLASAGVVEGTRSFNEPYHFLWHQVLRGVIPGVILFIIMSRIDYDVWRRWSFFLLLGAIALMMMVFIPAFSREVNGAYRWVDLGPISFQPAEFLKLALIVYLAAWFSGRRDHPAQGAQALIPFLLVLAVVGVLLIMQPDLGTLGLTVIIAIALFYFSGAQLKHLLILLLIAAILLATMAVIAPYRLDRVKAFLNPTEDTLGTSYHINQAKIAIGSGGIFGVGYGQSQQKHAFLPEPVGDSIFAVLVEELGLVGGMFLIGLFIVLLLTLMRIAAIAPDDFSKLFILGVAVWVVGQAFINIAAISGIIPLTGLPLPFISFGSSSLVSILTAMGIAVSVARYSE